MTSASVVLPVVQPYSWNLWSWSMNKDDYQIYIFTRLPIDGNMILGKPGSLKEYKIKSF